MFLISVSSNRLFSSVSLYRISFSRGGSQILIRLRRKNINMQPMEVDTSESEPIEISSESESEAEQETPERLEAVLS